MSFEKMTWGVKASFRSYVEAAEGSVEATEGAARTEDGTFIFPAVPGGDLTIAEDGSATGAVRFQGSVTFEAHGGMLKTTLTELGIEVGAEGLVLTAEQAPLSKDRIEIATLGLVTGGAGGPATLSASITTDGMYQIADNYPPGTELDLLQLD